MFVGYGVLLNCCCVEFFRHSRCHFQIVSRVNSRHFVCVILVKLFCKVSILLHHIQIVIEHGISVVRIFILLYE